MQAGEEVAHPEHAKAAWMFAAKAAVESAKNLQAHGLHKQIVNRVLEPFQMMKTVVTATEWDNFFELRQHKDAQPEIQVLANTMYEAMAASEPDELLAGEWHVPYVDRKFPARTCLQDWWRHPVRYRGRETADGDTDVRYFSNGEEIDEEDVLKVSASCCAQVSYRVLDTSLEKALFIYDKLVTSRPIHASPFEHQARANDIGNSNKFSGNLFGFTQYRKTLEV